MTDAPRYKDLPALFARVLPLATGDATPDDGRVYTYTSTPSAPPDHLTVDDAAAAYATITGSPFAESVVRMQAALRGLGEMAHALERLGTFRSIGLDFGRSIAVGIRPPPHPSPAPRRPPGARQAPRQAPLGGSFVENIAAVQAQAEALALIVSAYYDGLIRANVPEPLAADLTCAYQDHILRSAAEAQARAAQQAQGAQILTSLFGKT